MPFHHVRGLKFHLQRSGSSGPPVVLVHGLTGDLSIWFLCRAMAVFGASHRVLAYDLRGHGYSDAPDENYTSADHAADLLGLMDAERIESARIVGHSFGAVIGLHAAVIGPERVEALVLSDPYFPALRHLEDVSRWGHWQNFRREAMDAGVALSDEHWYDIGRFFDQVVHLEGDDLQRFRQAVGLPGLNRLLRLGRTTCGDDAKLEAGLTVEKIASVACPTLALYGVGSPFLATADYLVENLRDCRRAIVPGAKHRAPEENGEAFVALVDEFLRSLPTRSSTDPLEVSS